DDEGRRVAVPGDDVDLLALKLADDGLHAAAAHAHAGADRVNRGVVADDGNLGARAGIARHRLDLDDAVVDFRHLHREELRHELRMGARQEYLRPPLFAAHVIDIGTHAIAILEDLARDQLVAADDGLATAEVDDHIAVFDALDGAVDDLADAVLVVLVVPVALGLAHRLHDHLLGRLRGDTAEIHRRKLLGDEVADLGVGVAPARLLKRNLARRLSDIFHHLHQALELYLARLRIDVGADVRLLTVARARRLLDRVGHGRKHDLLVDGLLTRDRVGDLQKFQSVCTHYHFRLLEEAPR